MLRIIFKKFCSLKYLFNDLKLFKDTTLQMSCKKDKVSSLNRSQGIHEDINSAKKDVVERFLSILWKKEVEFNFSTK